MDLFTHLIDSLPGLLSWQVMLAMVVGSVFGIVIGALPGFSATMGIAVLLPLTFTMPPLVALGMIAGIYNGAMYGGAIPAILLRIPGTPAAIATVFDGYPMAQQGRGEAALRIALVSSALGSALSALLLIFMAPPLARLALQFGPAEMFWLAVFGLATIAMIVGQSPVKGWLSACIGLFLGTVGIDQITGDERFTFDSMHLAGGIDLLVLLTGLFAIPPVLDLAGKAITVPRDQVLLSGDGRSVAWLRLVPVWMRSSVIGIIVGIIPGAGGNFASLLSWNEARRTSARPERFGKGAPEGVAASECANNADTAASLIPALTLGVPGNAVAAVILGALLIHGLQPGPSLFGDPDKAAITYGFMGAMLITALILFFIGLAGARLFVNVLRLPATLLAPMVVVLTCIGIYSTGNSFADVWMMLGFGLLGFVMEKLDLPTAPTVLALILGPMAEQEFRRALMIGGGSPDLLVQSPISWLLMALIAVMLGLPLWRSLLRPRTA